MLTIILIGAILVALFISIQAHLKHATFKAQATEDLINLKDEVQSLRLRLETKTPPPTS